MVVKRRAAGSRGGSVLMLVVVVLVLCGMWWSGEIGIEDFVVAAVRRKRTEVCGLAIAHVKVRRGRRLQI